MGKTRNRRYWEARSARVVRFCSGEIRFDVFVVTAGDVVMGLHWSLGRAKASVGWLGERHGAQWCWMGVGNGWHLEGPEGVRAQIHARTAIRIHLWPTLLTVGTIVGAWIYTIVEAW